MSFSGKKPFVVTFFSVADGIFLAPGTVMELTC
jgi:hypothetical protein